MSGDSSARVLRLRPPPDGVLDHHDRAVDDEPEVERAEAHQVSRDVEDPHQDGGEEHRERDDGGDQQAPPPVAQEQDEHDDDEQRPLDQVLRHRPDGAVYQLRPVVERDQLDALRQGLLHLLDPLLHPLDDGA